MFKMTAKSVLLRPHGLRPRARAPTYPPCYATGFGPPFKRGAGTMYYHDEATRR